VSVTVFAVEEKNREQQPLTSRLCREGTEIRDDENSEERGHPLEYTVRRRGHERFRYLTARNSVDERG